MEKYFKRTSSLEIGSQNNSSSSSNKRRFLEFEVESLIADPGQRPKISSYHPNDRDKVRCAYLQRGPCQPRTHDFLQTACGSSFRRFNPSWFDDYGNWLEYSISKDAVFCLCCYLMKLENDGGNAFVTNGFSNWKKKGEITNSSTIDCIRFLLRQGLTFRENFLELLNFLAQHNEEIDRAFKNARGNIVRAAASETTKAFVNDLGDELFAVLEKMSVCLRYVNKEGQVREHFLGLVHVSNTNALSLKLALESLLETYNLSLSRVRGQGYDGISNMQGEFNGLKTLILKENSYAFYVHCFAHQLQLALVTVAKKQVEIALLFNLLTNLCNVVGASCKRRDMLRDSQMTKTIEALQSGEISSGHGNNSEQRAEACHLLNVIQSFEFIFNLHLMKNILGVTNELSQALQRNDQDIVNAMALVKVSKQRLQTIRDDGWSLLLDEVSLFCDKHNITVPKMDDIFVSQGRSRRKAQKISNLHHFQVEIFYQIFGELRTILATQLQELNNRFTEVNTELLLCIACLNPRHSFLAFDKEKLIQLAQFYPLEFSSTQLLVLDSQLENFILDVHSDDQFSNLNGICALSQKLVETRKSIVYPLVFLLLKLALVLSVATALVERTFSAMNIIKSRLRNRMGDEFLNDCLVTYIERETFDCIDNEKIIQSFQNMKPRRMEF
ncbi:hypothetical protein AAHE18_14G154900 [Arachis hypogaea]